MGTSASIAREYYRVQEYWENIDADKTWRLAIWVVRYADVDIVNKFMEIERSVLGKFDDIFFRFDSPWKGDGTRYEKDLYEEWAGWFSETPDHSLDMLRALKNGGELLFDYRPDMTLEPTAVNLWKEMLRFKSSVKSLVDTGFCFYIPPGRPEGEKLTEWFSRVPDSVPEGIRLVTVDFAEKRKVRLSPSAKVRVIKPDLDMPAAISNDMEKGILASDAASVENRYALQIKRVMECTTKKNGSLLDREIKKLFSLSEQINTVSVSISTLFFAAQACFMINAKEKCETYSDRAIAESAKAMEAGAPDGYSVWKAAVLLKAALLAGDKKRREAIELYEKLAEEASGRKDIFHIMEAYRMAGHFYYELGELNASLESLLLSLYAGSFLEKEIRRQSTFLFSAALALHLSRQTRTGQDTETLENSLEEWLGSDWRELVETEEMKKVRERRKGSIFS
jgi:tetratricopeptide (TPR) repeat protein